MTLFLALLLILGAVVALLLGFCMWLVGASVPWNRRPRR